jgi:hypothetical protein
LIDLAAAELVRLQIDGPHWQDDAGLKDRLAAALSQRIGRNPNLHRYRQAVKPNWVTRHRLELERKRLSIGT